MRIADIYARTRPTVSFEFFPPKTDEAEQALFEKTVPELKKLRPSFISVTYGAGGSTRDKTLRMVARAKRDHGLEAMAHLTCVGSTKDMLGAVLDEAAALGIDNILALRGDPPKGQTEFKAVDGGFGYALDLVKFVKSRNRFSIGVAGYPEGHLECGGDKRVDWDRCAAKVEAGGEFVITQLFYDVEDFLAFEDYLRNKRGVKVPIVPGVLPFLGAEQIKRFTSLCGSKIPDALRKKIEAAGDDESVRKVGVEACTEICSTLLKRGGPGIHFYCLNRSQSVREIMHNLGLAE